MQNEMDVFTKIFKNYTNTNMNSVDMNAVNNKIKNFVNPVGIKNDDNSNQNNLRMNKIKQTSTRDSPITNKMDFLIWKV